MQVAEQLNPLAMCRVMFASLIWKEQLQSSEQPLRFQRLGSGIALLQRIEGRWFGAADTRREGAALALPGAAKP